MKSHIIMRKLVLCAVVSPLAMSGCADSEPAPTQTPTQTLDVTGQTDATITSTTLLPGDTVVDHDLSAEVPDRGESVKAIAELVAGGSQTLSVETGADGSVTITRGDPAADQDTCHSPGACSDPQFRLEGPRWPGGLFKWFFQAGSTPKANDVNNVETRLRSAAHNMGTGRNNCGISPNLSSSAQYQGRTTAAPGVTWAPGQRQVRCGRSDGRNVVGFGALPEGILASTCHRGVGPNMVEADTRINSNVSWYASDTIPGGCFERFGIEPVMTHEFGHAFGLDDVKECHHGWLTMSAFTAQCDNSQNTLGLGDIKGMQQLYGR